MNDLEHAVALLRQGRLVAFPTETVYGLGADATNAEAIERVYAAKGRPSTNPLIIHIADMATALRFVAAWPESAQKLAQHFWPGPLTIVLPKKSSAQQDRVPSTPGSERSDDPGPAPTAQSSALDNRELVIPDNATAGLQTVALRVPSHPLALELLRAFAGPLAAPSANRSTRISPTSAQHVRDEFPDSAAAGGGADNDPAMILDGGPCTVGIESTVLDLTGATPTILRPGHITAADFEPLIGPVAVRSHAAPADVPSLSPGQHVIHYAPHTPTYRFETSQRGLIQPENNGIVVVSPLVALKRWGSIVAMPNDPAQYAQRLYAVLRDLDDMNLRAIFIEMPPDRPEWAAIRDRLVRATRPLPRS